MCRRSDLLGLIFLAFGAGLILSCIISSLFWRLLTGIILVVIGLLIKKC